MLVGGWGLVAQSVLNLLLLAQSEPEENKPTRVDAPITAVYTPSGFDDNDVAQIIIEGEFPNTCYSTGKVTLRTRLEDLEQGVIQFHMEALKYNRKNCLQVKTPFLKVVDLGILPAGAYSILQLKDLRKRATLVIHKAENEELMDNHTYAPVDAMFVRDDALGFRRLAVLVGTFSNSCMKFEDATPVYRSDPQAQIIEILPIVKMLKDEECVEKTIPFFHVVEIPDNVPSGRYLFHIRTMNGNSLNKMDTIKME